MKKITISWMSAVALVFGCTVHAAPNNSPYWDFTAYGTRDLKTLLAKSIDSESTAEKVRIRSYVAAQAPETQEGLFSLAWLAAYEGKKDQSDRMYADCVQRFPPFAVCLNNAIAASPDDLTLRRKAVEIAPESFDFAPVRDYFAVLTRRKMVDERAALVKRVAANFQGQWIVPLLESMDADDRGDPKASREALRMAIATGAGKPPFFVYQQLIKLETGQFYDGPREKLAIAMDLVVNYLKDTKRFDEYEPWAFLINEYADGEDVKRVSLLRQYVNIYDTYARTLPQPRPIPAEVFELVSRRGLASANDTLGPWLKKFRERFNARRRLEPEIANSAARFETATDGDLGNLATTWNNLVRDALTEKDAASYAVNAVLALTDQRGDCTVAQQLAVGWEPRLAANLYFQRNAFEAALCANDLVSARKRLDAVSRLDTAKNAIDRSDRVRLALAESQAKAWQEQENANPFLKQWDQKDGGRVAINIEFATGSSVIPPRYVDALAQLGQLLKDKGASDYQFDIAGHTDNRGNAASNQKLSEQRAQAVVDYLVAKLGIEKGRVSSSGRGSSVPVATNASDAGMQQNRRVEISPRSSLRTPVLAQVGQPYGDAVLSPDGRILASGNALWDTKTRLKLRDLPRASVRQMEFLPNGRSLLRLTVSEGSSRKDVVLEILDVSSGLVMRRQLLNGDFFAVSPDGRSLATIVAGQVQIFGLPSLRLAKQKMMSVLSAGGRITWVGNERLAGAVRADGEKLQLLNAATLATEKVLDDADYVHTVGTSRTGKLLVAITNDGLLHAWDVQTWQHKAQKIGAFADRFVFHPFEDKALINQWNGNTRRTRLIDFETMNVVKTFEASDGVANTAFTPDGRKFFLNGQEYDSTSLVGKPWSTQNEQNPDAGFDAWDTVKGQFLLRDGADQLIWDVATARQVDRMVGLRLCDNLSGSTSLHWKCDVADANQIAVEKGTWRQIVSPNVYKKRESQYREAATLKREVYFERDAARTEGQVATHGKLSIVDRVSGQVLAVHPILLRLEDSIYRNDDALESGDVDTRVDNTGRYLALRVWWKEHWGYPALSGKQVRLFDLETGKELPQIDTATRVERISFAPGDDAKLRIGFKASTSLYDVANKQWRGQEPWSATETLQAESGAQKLISQGNVLTLLTPDAPERYVFLRKDVATAQLFPSQNLLVVSYGGGELDYFDLKTLTKQLSLHVKQKGEWLAYAPSGEFSSSLKGADGYYWALGEKYLPFGALRERFERPNVIAQKLQQIAGGNTPHSTAFNAAPLNQEVGVSIAAPTTTVASPSPALAVPANNPASIEADVFLPPFSLRLIDFPTKSSDSKLSLSVGVTKTRAVAAQPEVELNINGQQVKTRGLARQTAPSACADSKAQIDCEQIFELPMNLDAGRNLIAVSLLYRNVRIETKTSVIEYEKPRQITDAAPRLWLFAAGVSEYKASAQNLQFAHRDVLELAKTMKTQEGKIFSQVNVKVLTNAEVSKGQLETEMNRFLRQASAQDLIVVSLAGHGVQDNDQTLYFMTHDAIIEEPFTGLDVANVRGILRNRPTNQKVLLLLDICHAGAVGEGKRGRLSSEDAVKLLTEGTGVTVLSSSTGRELSNEGAQYRGGHGAFTAAVLDGIDGSADRQGNGDGVVTLAELMTFVMRRVPETTRNSQHPTMPLSERLQDYPIALVKP